MARLNWNTLGGGRGRLPRETWEPDEHAFSPTARQPVERSKTHPTEAARRRQEAKEVRERLRSLSERLRDEQPERVTKPITGRRRTTRSERLADASPREAATGRPASRGAAGTTARGPRAGTVAQRRADQPRKAKTIRNELEIRLSDCRVYEGQLAAHAGVEPMLPQTENGARLWTKLKPRGEVLRRLDEACGRVAALRDEGRRAVGRNAGSPALVEMLDRAANLHPRFVATLRRHRGGTA